MQEKHLFEYATIRVMPRVERGEFINVGVIVYCSSQKFLKTVFELNKERLQAFSAELDLVEIEERLMAFRKICEAANNGGPIAKLPIASRFRWLIAARSTIVQTSPVHPGMCCNAGETLEKLFAQLVL
ncbi:MAG: hypothetical protein JWQ96_516 [Segetibacter sp.]|nr:hypothetical protein [Segetibacter sp.]